MGKNGLGERDTREFVLRSTVNHYIFLGKIAFTRVIDTLNTLHDAITPDDDDKEGVVLPFPLEQPTTPQPPADPRISHVRILQGEEAKEAEKRKSVGIFDQDALDDEV